MYSTSSHNVQSFYSSVLCCSTLHVRPSHMNYVTCDDVTVRFVEIHPLFHQRLGVWILIQPTQLNKQSTQ